MFSNKKHNHQKYTKKYLFIQNFFTETEDFAGAAFMVSAYLTVFTALENGKDSFLDSAIFLSSVS